MISFLNEDNIIVIQCLIILHTRLAFLTLFSLLFPLFFVFQVLKCHSCELDTTAHEEFHHFTDFIY